MTNAYDFIVIGARCAGSPTAMLLARLGYRVLVVDRASFPSDTVSTHVVQPLAAAAMQRWGLLDRLIATGCPPVHTYSFDFGPFTLAGAPGTAEAPVAYCPRRTVLDKLLVDGAVEAGAELREGFIVDELLIEDGRVAGITGHAKSGAVITERARVVVGADGRHSLVADAVQPEAYHQRPQLLANYYTYFSGLPMEGRFEVYVRGDRGFAAVQTHDGLTMVVGGWPFAQFDANKRDFERHYLQAFDRAPAFAARVRAARREEPFAGATVPNFFRKPYGPGWALVGDAGYTKDPITAQGINDAFRDAERCATALDQALSGARGYDDAMAGYQRDRDAHVHPMYDFTCGVASLEPPPPEMQQVFAAIHGNQAAMDGFARVNAGTTSPAAFFTPDNIGAIMAAAAGRGGAAPV